MWFGSGFARRPAMRFEWDESKRRDNIRKHQVDFEDTAAVFRGPLQVRIDPRGGYGEDRWLGIGLCEGFPLLVVFAERNDDVIRLISARKASRHESEILGREIRKNRH